MSESQSSAAPAQSRGPGTLQLGIVVAILAAGIGLTALTSDVSRTSEPGVRVVDGHPFLPAQAGPWTGSAATGLTPEEQAVLPKDTEGVRRFYTNSVGTAVYCSVVLAGADVTSIHRPELCLTGQGWKLDASKVEEIPMSTAAGGKLGVTRMNASMTVHGKDGSTGTAYSVFVYWFVGKDRTTPSHAQRIFWSTLDRVIHNRNHRWAYFLINSICPPGSAPAAAQDATMGQVSNFIQDIYPQLAVP